MAKPSLLSLLSLCFLVMFQCGFARQQGQYQKQNECQLQRINALEPTGRCQGEAGVTEYWDPNNDEFQCAGVAVIRHIIEPKGLLLPSYTNTPIITYIVKGRGYHGVVLPGCAETFQSSQQQSQYQREGEGEGEGESRRKRFEDQHQKIRHFREGDIVAFPAGVAHWLYNNGDQDLVAVVLFDTSNDANQLDNNPRRFFIAGNPEASKKQGGGQMRGKQFETAGNVFRGFDVRILAEVFGVNTETARKLQSEDDRRGHIIRVERGLQVIRPPTTWEEQERQERSEREEGRGRGRGNVGNIGNIGINGLEETICSMRLRENINDPSRADVFNPRAGRLSTLNSMNLPILRYLQLSAEKVTLYRNAIMSPHWNLNAHSVLYVTRGQAQVQIVDNRGEAVFQGKVQEGQILVVPQNFAVVKRAGDQGCEWVAFKTNDNAMINTLAGKTSALRGIPVDVLANAYRISPEEAFRLKFNRDATSLFAPSSRSEQMRASV